jgi:hypothetical protein
VEELVDLLDRESVRRSAPIGPVLGLCDSLRDKEQWLGLPVHYLFDAIPLG